MPLNDVSWLGLVSMRAGGAVGQGELGLSGKQPLPTGTGCGGAATPALPTGTFSHLPLQKAL